MHAESRNVRVALNGSQVLIAVATQQPSYYTYNVLASEYYTNTSDVKLTKLFFGFVYPADSHVVQFASEMRES